MHIFWKYITASSLKMPCVGIFVKYTLCALYSSQNNFCKPEQREDNSYNLTMGPSTFSYELTFWLILIKTSGKHKSKNTLRVEINQFCGSWLDTMRSYHAVDKIWGVKLPHPLLEK